MPLDALALAASTLSVVVWLAIFLQTATTTEVARHAARGQHDAAGRVVGAAYAVAAGWGVVTSAIVAGIAPWLVGLLGGHEASGAATTYIRVAVLGLPFLYPVLRGQRPSSPAWRTPGRRCPIAVGANAVGVALEELRLVFGLHTRLIGSAWGTVAAQVLAAGAYGYASLEVVRTRRRPPAGARSPPCSATGTGCPYGRSRSGWCRSPRPVSPRDSGRSRWRGSRSPTGSGGCCRCRRMCLAVPAQVFRQRRPQPG